MRRRRKADLRQVASCVGVDQRLWSRIKRNALESAAQALMVSEESRDSIRERHREKRLLFDVVRLR